MKFKYLRTLFILIYILTGIFSVQAAGSEMIFDSNNLTDGSELWSVLSPGAIRLGQKENRLTTSMIVTLSEKDRTYPNEQALGVRIIAGSSLNTGSDGKIYSFLVFPQSYDLEVYENRRIKISVELYCTASIGKTTDFRKDFYLGAMISANDSSTPFKNEVYNIQDSKAYYPLDKLVPEMVSLEENRSWYIVSGEIDLRDDGVSRFIRGLYLTAEFNPYRPVGQNYEETLIVYFKSVKIEVIE